MIRAIRTTKISLTNTRVSSRNDTPEAFFDGYRRLGDSSEVSDNAVHLGPWASKLQPLV
jgi:hypothetical protein